MRRQNATMLQLTLRTRAADILAAIKPKKTHERLVNWLLRGFIYIYSAILKQRQFNDFDTYDIRPALLADELAELSRMYSQCYPEKHKYIIGTLPTLDL